MAAESCRSGRSASGDELVSIGRWANRSMNDNSENEKVSVSVEAFGLIAVVFAILVLTGRLSWQFEFILLLLGEQST
jgi:hypothetical protein